MTKPLDMHNPGQHMTREIAQSVGVFCAAATQEIGASLADLACDDIGAFYTIARGSSDAVANILSYEFMRVLGKPMTSLPPSVFSIGQGVSAENSASLVISQSGASADLVRSAKGLAERGSRVIALTNNIASELARASHSVIDIEAGPELATPATKTVIGSIGAGLAFLAALCPPYGQELHHSAALFKEIGDLPEAEHHALLQALLKAKDVYIVGRDTGYGAAHELALKTKETCAIHAEAYSASEVLHGPLQLASERLLVLVLDTGFGAAADSLNEAVTRMQKTGAHVHVIRPHVAGLNPAVAAAAILRHVYPVICETALALGFDPDRPKFLSKVTQTL